MAIDRVRSKHPKGMVITAYYDAADSLREKGIAVTVSELARVRGLSPVSVIEYMNKYPDLKKRLGVTD
jgi:hypothetical protein